MACGIKNKKKRKKYNIGGNINGPSHKNGGVIIEAEGGEYIIKNKSVIFSWNHTFNFYQWKRPSPGQINFRSLRPCQGSGKELSNYV